MKSIAYLLWLVIILFPSATKASECFIYFLQPIVSTNVCVCVLVCACVHVYVCVFVQDFILNQDWNDPKSQLQQCCLTLRKMGGGEPDIPVYK